MAGGGRKGARRNAKQVKGLKAAGRPTKRKGRGVGQAKRRERALDAKRHARTADASSSGEDEGSSGEDEGPDAFLDGEEAAAEAAAANGAGEDSGSEEDVDALLDAMSDGTASASTSDSEEEEGSDGAEADAAKAGTRHRATLEALKQKDPEFYRYLEQTDKNLLGFDAADGDQDEGDGEEGAAPAEGAEAAAGAKVTQVDAKELRKWCDAAQKGSLGALRRILTAYRAACHLGDDKGDGAASAHMLLTSSGAYNSTMIFALTQADRCFREALGLKKGQELDAAKLAKLPRWKKTEPLIRSYVGNTAAAMNGITDGNALAFLLRRIRASADLMAPFPRLAKKVLKAALKHFGAGVGDEELDRTVRIQAALLVRVLASYVEELSEEALKGFVKAYLASARQGTAFARPSLRLMADCVVEVLAVDLTTAYQQCFAGLRSIAMQLRDALSMSKQGGYLQIYCWQTINALDFWERVVATYGRAPGDALHPLVYPLSQLLLGTARLVPTPRYFPLRFHVVQTLNRLAAASGVLIPVAPVVTETLQFAGLSQRPTGGAGKVDQGAVAGILKVSKAALKTTSFQEQCVTRATQLLAEHFGEWATHISFPELAHPTVLQLKRFLKASPVEKFRRQVKQLAEAMQANSDLVLRRRQNVSFSPKDLEEVDRWSRDAELRQASPLLKYAAALAQQARQAQAAATATDLGFAPMAAAAADEAAAGGGGGGPGPGPEAGLDLLPQKPAKQRKEKRKERLARAALELGTQAAGDDGEDVVEDLVLSDDDDSSDAGDAGGGGHGGGALSASDSEEDDEEEAAPSPRRKGKPSGGGGKKKAANGRAGGGGKRRRR